MTVSRRQALKLAAAAAATPLLPPIANAAFPATPAPPVVAAPALAPQAGRVINPPDKALRDELVERIIPADAHSGGARAAGVAAYIDARLADYDPQILPLREERERWRRGLAAVDAASREASGQAFLASTPAARSALLERLAVGETKRPPETPQDRGTPAAEKPETLGLRFFPELKSWTVRGYYTSRLGIHDEMEYKGNTLLPEFVGADPATLTPVKPQD